MKVAKASERDMEMAAKLCALLESLDRNYYPEPVDGTEAKDDAPTFFDEGDEEHLAYLHQQLKATLAMGNLWRVVMGMHCALHNEVFDPAADTLEWHPALSFAVEIRTNGWKPDAEHINALPEPLRKFVVDLETRVDPAGDLAARVFAEDQVRQLTAQVAELRKDRERLDWIASEHVRIFQSPKSNRYFCYWGDSEDSGAEWQNEHYETARAAIDAAITATSNPAAPEVSAQEVS